MRFWMDHSGSWMFVIWQEMPCCKQRYAHVNSNQLCAEDKAIKWRSRGRPSTLIGFESLLTFIGKSKLQTKSSSWSLVSKLVHHKRVACEREERDANEFEMVDAALQSLISHKPSKSDFSLLIDNVQNGLGKLELNIQDLEEVLECLSRSIVKTRVSLLNILNH
ncbi:hypothetical protein SO802_010788 [Lithocarpus litseifolius]|uniref:Uncharacterized protein n=1 Tax=Lithocarpus litseifolius TaxID=425828 RepID=A0AAW2DJP6_9ROSI